MHIDYPRKFIKRLPLIMATLQFLFGQHKSNALSTFVLLIISLPLLSVSVYGYILLLIVIMARSFLLYGAVAYGIGKDRKAYALQVVRNISFRKALVSTIVRASYLEREEDRSVLTLQLGKTTVLH